MITAPASTPTISAICCAQGAAPTSWPVFRSCRLSLEVVAAAKTMESVNSAKAISALVPPSATIGTSTASRLA